MKRTLLFSLLGALPFTMFAQNKMMPELDVKKLGVIKTSDLYQAPTDIDFYKNTEATTKNVASNSTSGKSEAISTVDIGQSANVFSVLTSMQTCLTANQDLNLLMFTHRTDVAPGNDIMVSYSTDGGATWQARQVTTGHNNRYPSGVIVNPSGNTQADQAYAVTTGPTTDGASWSENFWSSIRLDGQNNDEQYLNQADPNWQQFPRAHLQATADGVAHVVAFKYKNDTTLLLEGIYINNGKYDSGTNKINWDRQLIDPGLRTINDTTDFGYVGNAWSQDGQTGYIITFGRDATTDFLAYQPIVFKSTDAGATWNKMPVIDYGTLPGLKANLFPIQRDTSIVVPRWYYNVNGIDFTVDANGDLHMFTGLQGRPFDHPDSLGFSYIRPDDGTGEAWSIANVLCDVYTNGNNWGALALDTISSMYVPTSQSANILPMSADPANPPTWGHRIQAGRTKDGSKVFVTWTDTEINFGGKYNTSPDIKAYGINVNTGEVTGTIPVTQNTVIYGFAYFHYMSDIVLTNGSTNTIPLTVTEFGADAIDPVTHKYIQGVDIMDSDFGPIGIDEKNNNPVTLVRNFPNPFTGQTMINIGLDQASDVQLTVYNTVGQVVESIDLGKLASGSHVVPFNGSDLNSGIYFYEVKAGAHKLTSKMIIH